MIRRFVSWKSLLLIAILNSPPKKWNQTENGKHPFSAIQVATRMMSAVNAEQGNRENDNNNLVDISIHRPGPSLKEWRLNTNFDNVDNWQGLRGHENCTKNIYEFPEWYGQGEGQELVVTLPSTFIGKQIILPVNGHFVFREGVTTFSPSSLLEEQEATCRGREVKYLRTKRADWFDPDNWIPQGALKTSQDGSTLLNYDSKATGNGNNIRLSTSVSSPAIPHVERVPCQYDSVQFPKNSSFNLKISSNVTIANFFLCDKKHSYTDVAILMNSPLGKLQFQKKPETIFSITSSTSNRNADSNQGTGTGTTTANPTTTSSSAKCGGNDEQVTDSDQCICANYERELTQKICNLADCSEDVNEDDCPSPIVPHGFCCPVCGFHIKIRHSGNLRLVPLYSKLKSEITRTNLQGKVHIHMSRHKKRSAHIVILAAKQNLQQSNEQKDKDNDLLVQIGRLVLRIESILNKEESEVIGVTLTESWGELLPSGESSKTSGDGSSSDRLEGSGLGGGLITLIVLLLLVAVLGGIALFIFIWNKKHGYPPLTLSSVTSAFPRMPSMRIPILPGAGGGSLGGGRRSSTLSNSLHSFGFARFTNERVSSVTIGPAAGSDTQNESGGTKESGKTGGKSSTIRRAEQVDDEPLPMTSTSATTNEEKITHVDSGTFEFSNVTYDLVAGVEGGESGKDGEKHDEKDKVKAESIPPPKPPKNLLAIPEVTVVDMEDQGSTSGDFIEPITKTTATSSSSSAKIAGQTSSTSSSTNNGNKDESSSKPGKFSKPSFIASRMASAYKKLAPEVGDTEKAEEQDRMVSTTGVETSKKGKKKVKGVEADSNTNREKENKSSPTTAAATTTTTTTIFDSNQQSRQVERQEDQGIFQEFIAVAENTVAAAAAAMPARVEEAKIIDFEE